MIKYDIHYYTRKNELVAVLLQSDKTVDEIKAILEAKGERVVKIRATKRAGRANII